MDDKELKAFFDWWEDGHSHFSREVSEDVYKELATLEARVKEIEHELSVYKQVYNVLINHPYCGETARDYAHRHLMDLLSDKEPNHG
jgi:hypothetical protein